MTPFEDMLADALTTVRLIPRWQLPEETWPQVEEAIARLEEGVRQRDGRAVSAALRDIEDRGPTRLSMIGRDAGSGADERRAPPPRVLDLVNTLVHGEEPDGR